MNGLRRKWWARWVERRVPREASLTLGHRVLFVLPTDAGVGVLMVAVLLFIGGANYTNALMLGASYFLASLVSACIWLAYRNMAGITVRWQPIDDMTATVPGDLTALIDGRQRRRYAVTLSLADSAVCQDVGDLAAAYELRLTFPSRGHHHVPRLRLESRYPLGLVNVWTWVAPPERVWVYPAPEEVPVTSRGDQEGEGMLQRIPHTVSDDEFRRFRDGDGWSRIVWKMAARGAPLSVRDDGLEAGGNHRVRLLELPGPGLERQISQATAWIFRQDAEGARYGILEAGLSGSGSAHRRMCLRWLATLGQEGP